MHTRRKLFCPHGLCTESFRTSSALHQHTRSRHITYFDVKTRPAASEGRQAGEYIAGPALALIPGFLYPLITLVLLVAALLLTTLFFGNNLVLRMYELSVPVSERL